MILAVTASRNLRYLSEVLPHKLPYSDTKQAAFAHSVC